jgi:hypothetical protein
MTPDQESAWPALPVETEIYILPNGEIVVADLPAELAAQIAQLTQGAVSPPITNADYVADQQHPTQPDQRG